MIIFLPHDETHIKIQTPDFGIDQELGEFFSFFADGYKFSPKYRAGIWDGRIRIFDSRYNKLPKGLLKIAVRFCKDRGYEFSIDPELNPKLDIDLNSVDKFIDDNPVTTKGKLIQARDYQVDAIKHSMTYYRNLCIAPTSAGKSLILYYKIRYHIDVLGHNVVLVVPTTQLVQQMYGDFLDYSECNGWDVDANTQLLYSGKEKVFAKNLMIATWQSLAAMYKGHRDKFEALTERTDLLCLDELHVYKADVTLATVNKFHMTKWRTGTTGTLDDSKINKLQLIGVMAEPYQVITTKQLMDQDSIVKLKIHMLKLTYPDSYKAQLKGMDYKDEINHLVTLEARNDFISELASNCKGVTLVLFTYVEKHGAILHDKIQKLNPNRSVNFIHGKVDVDEREQVRSIADKDPNCIIIASSSIFSTGTNIPAIENIIFAMPTKSTIRVRQLIGRGLRLRKGKSMCNLFDISDDLTYGSYSNTTFNHMFSRMEIYKKEQFDFTVKAIPMLKYLQQSTSFIDFSE